MKRTLSAKLLLNGVILLGAWGAPRLAFAKDYYVAPTGSDSAAGTLAAPFATIAKAQTSAAAGDTVYFRGGKFAYTAGTNTCSSQTATVNAIVLNKSGTAGNLIHYVAYTGETPVFDFSGMKDDCRVKGFDVTGNYIHIKGFEITGAPQNNNLNHESWGLWNSGSNNIFELINAHHNMGPGVFIQDGGNNLILNCDSHDNYDPLTSNGAGQSADGFGCHVSAGHTGNVFRGCRAWWNTDDGFDFINAFEACTVENSWAWYAGYLPGTMTSVAAGNGNGIKAGGYGGVYQANAPQHIVRNCLAVANKSAGFYANHHPDSPYFYNNTSYGNNPDYNMLGIDSAGAANTVGVYRNNIAFSGTLFSNRSGADETFNSWTVSGITVSAADFQNVSVTGLDAPRQADGSLPVLTNFHLAAGSDLIDKGTNVGLPYAGSAPDLGCFETGLVAATGGTSSSGGVTAAGGATSATGGAASGGRAATGGVAGSAGNAGTAGRAAAGGATASSGGVTNGGAQGNAGAISAGGTNGGAQGNAGATATNGGANPAAGGSSATAGANSVTGGTGTAGGVAAGGASTANGGGTVVASAGGNIAQPGSGGATSNGTSGGKSSTAGAASGGASAGETGGCSCSTEPRRHSPAAALASLLLLGAALRRRGQRAPRKSAPCLARPFEWSRRR